MSIIKLPLCYKCGVPHVPDEVAQRVRSGEDITIDIIPQRGLAAQVLATGTGALNIDASRIGGSEQIETGRNGRTECKSSAYGNGLLDTEKSYHGKRFPSNTLFSHSEQCQARGEKRVRGDHKAGQLIKSNGIQQSVYGKGTPHIGDRYTDEEGMEVVQNWQCAPDCPVAVLDAQSGVRKSAYPGNPMSAASQSGKNYGVVGNRVYEERIMQAGPQYTDTGSAARYFQCFPPSPVEDMIPYIYTSKASRRERNEGCEALPEREAGVGNVRPCGDFNQTLHPERGLDYAPVKHQNNHPTVKPLSLLKYLIAMITPPNGIVLDMFAGSGTTGVAAAQCGFHYILIEQEQEYIDICRARLAHAHAGSPETKGKASRATQRIAGWGQMVARCPEHGDGKPTGFSGNCYTCGCKIIRIRGDESNTAPAPRERPVDTRPTLWEVPE